MGCQSNPVRSKTIPCPEPEIGATKLFPAEQGQYQSAHISSNACNVALEYQVGKKNLVNINGIIFDAKAGVKNIEFPPEGGFELFFYREKLRFAPYFSFSWMGYGKNEIGLFEKGRTLWRNRDGVISAVEDKYADITFHESGMPMATPVGSLSTPPSSLGFIESRGEHFFATIVGVSEWGGYDQISDLRFSPDTKSWAFQYSKGGLNYLNIHGVVYGPFEEVGGVFWPQVGQRFAFKYRNGNQYFINLSGRVMGPYHGLSGSSFSGFAFSYKGDCYGFLFEQDGKWFTQLCDRVLPGHENNWGWDLSPDHSTFVYMVGQGWIGVNGELHEVGTVSGRFGAGSPLYTPDGGVMEVRYEESNQQFLRLNATVYGGYQEIDPVRVSPDSSTLVFTYQQSGKHFMRAIPRSLLVGQGGKDLIREASSPIFFRFLPDGKFATVYIDSGMVYREVSIGKSKPFFNPNPPKFPLQVQMQMHPFPEKSLIGKSSFFPV